MVHTPSSGNELSDSLLLGHLKGEHTVGITNGLPKNFVLGLCFSVGGGFCRSVTIDLDLQDEF